MFRSNEQLALDQIANRGVSSRHGQRRAWLRQAHDDDLPEHRDDVSRFTENH